MTKQDIYDIIYLLEPLFDENNMEIRNNIAFRFKTESDWFDYDDENIWIDHDEIDSEVYKDDKDDDLEININTDIDDGVDIITYLDKNILKYSLFLKCIKYLQQEFNIDLKDFECRNDSITITIKKEPKNESIHLKKFNQF